MKDEKTIYLLRSDIPKQEIEHLSYALRTGRPFGSAESVVEMEKKLERKLLQCHRGRPRKEAQ